MILIIYNKTIIINNHTIIVTWNIFSTILKHFRFSELDLGTKGKAAPIPDSLDGTGGQTDSRTQPSVRLPLREKHASKDGAL